VQLHLPSALLTFFSCFLFTVLRFLGTTDWLFGLAGTLSFLALLDIILVSNSLVERWHRKQHTEHQGKSKLRTGRIKLPTTLSLSNNSTRAHTSFLHFIRHPFSKQPWICLVFFSYFWLCLLLRESLGYMTVGLFFCKEELRLSEPAPSDWKTNTRLRAEEQR
jgi:hypothetical protein